ncbi:MAG: 4-hydroxybenzoyl-CoA reductase [Hamadaea sp.]|uniref:CGNR zinc finger domain-containing protein n=1 Tax=Hamadaea sp. TaxID=2024425 RepID=UPI0018033F02|nr:ABATE domain-containing protein [Hamadaea sp.]NUR72363.1 4-hydroxybenzoyl-CoA reductase [Hamadaea sp.]NUT20264.1 4-hydroxybenzoyl-CoA reductase [Hamadaea sp.]
MIADEAAFRFVAGRPSVDFTGTLGKRRREEPVERIPEAAALGRWFVESGLTDEPVVVPATALRQAYPLREALYRLMRAPMRGERPTRADLELVNHWAARTPPAVALTADLTVRLVEPTVQQLFALLARDGVDLLGGPYAERLRECSSETCTLLYLDTSRAGSRRWCSMELCGSRDKMSRYRRRAAAT